jgi:WD40 repeat protein
VTANAAPNRQGSAPPSPAAPSVAPPSPRANKYSYCLPGDHAQAANFIGGPSNPLTLKLTATPREVRTIAVSPDGTRVVSGGDDTVIRVWDAASLKWIANITGHGKEVYGLAFSDDGKLLASASLDGTVRIWDAHSFSSHPLHVFSAGGATGPVKQWSVAFEPGADPHYVDSAGDDGNVWIWNIASESLASRRSSGDQAVRSLSFAPHGNGEFATADFDGKVRFFADSGRITAVPAGTGKALHVAYAPGGDWVATAGVDSSGRGVKVWNAASHTLLKAYLGHKSYANAVAWSRDGNTIVSGGGAVDRTVRLWDVQSGNQLQVFTGHAADIEAVAFHPNQKWLISAGEDGTMKIWDIASANELLSVVGFDNGDYLAYAPSGCYTGSADAANYVTYIAADKSDTHDNGKDKMFVPGDATALLLPQ